MVDEVIVTADNLDFEASSRARKNTIKNLMQDSRSESRIPNLSTRTTKYKVITLPLKNLIYNVDNTRVRSFLQDDAQIYDIDGDDAVDEMINSKYEEMNNIEMQVKLHTYLFEDEAQDENSLSVLYRLFTEEIKPLRMLPNVLVVESLSNTNDIAESVINWLNSFESSSSLDIGNTIKQFVEESDSNEHVLTLECSGLIKSAYDESILQDPLEGKYYQEITADFCHIISKELKGLNEYGAPQDMSSRRFYYSSNSCISSLHFKPREKTLELICTFRSTDAQKNAAIDFQFLEYLVHRMKSEYFLNCSHYRIALTMNSVHLR